MNILSRELLIYSEWQAMPTNYFNSAKNVSNLLWMRASTE